MKRIAVPTYESWRNRVKFVRWKRYGFTHLTDNFSDEPVWDDEYDTQPGIRGKTLCGTTFRIWFPHPRLSYIDRQDDGTIKGELQPSTDDDGKRPLCGICKKYLRS